MATFDYLLLAFTALAGGTLGLLYSSFARRYLHLLLSFSGAYLLGITAVHLIPEAFGVPAPYTGYALLAGFFLQILLDQLSRGVEHGHIHLRHGSGILSVFIGLSLHAFIEGTPLNLLHEPSHLAHGHGSHLFEGILLHKLPAGFALGILLHGAGIKRGHALLYILLFAVMTPAGAFFASYLPVRLVPLLLALVIGTLLHVSTTILFEADGQDGHRISYAKLAAIVSGVLLATFISG